MRGLEKGCLSDAMPSFVRRSKQMMKDKFIRSHLFVKIRDECGLTLSMRERHEHSDAKEKVDKSCGFPTWTSRNAVALNVEQRRPSPRDLSLLGFILSFLFESVSYVILSFIALGSYYRFSIITSLSVIWVSYTALRPLPHLQIVCVVGSRF